ncbi:UNKNOWN [Stylonychia lemnae]|uniref:F5/8 type C domain-containing protein n=1 Tax=Stylonychia lemnae TaxID=5949 RepID=A0A078AVY7_STYLE|nr:UNKNOWN [Stylonychia lemnae]|eukprot:CDW86339.1 UNKNOWN [Stylonychia lemnae]
MEQRQKTDEYIDKDDWDSNVVMQNDESQYKYQDRSLNLGSIQVDQSTLNFNLDNTLRNLSNNLPQNGSSSTRKLKTGISFESTLRMNDIQDTSENKPPDAKSEIVELVQDVQSVSQTIMFKQKEHIKNQANSGNVANTSKLILIWNSICRSITWFSFIKLLFASTNQVIVATVICCTKLSESGSLGLITNFSAILIVCEFDDILYNVMTISKFKRELRQNLVEQYKSLRKEAILKIQTMEDPENTSQIPEQQLQAFPTQAKSIQISASQEMYSSRRRDSIALDKQKSFQLILQIEKNKVVMKALSKKFKKMWYQKLNDIIQKTPEEYETQLYSRIEENFMKIKIDVTKVNGKIFNILKLHWVCKFIFVASISFLAYGDIHRAARLNGANQNGYRLTSSSSFPSWEVTHSRLDTDFQKQQGQGSAWCPLFANTSEYIQISSTIDEYWDNLIIQGSPDNDNWVTQVAIYYSDDIDSFQLMKIADANSDRNTKVKIDLDRTVKAQTLRIQPLTWNNYPCLRFDAYFISN